MKYSKLLGVVILILTTLTTSCMKEVGDNDLTVVSWGGKYQELLFKHWLLPSAKSAKLKIKGQSYGGEYRNISRMVETDTVTWDLVQVETFYAALAQKNGLLEKYEPEVSSELIVNLDSQTRKLMPFAYPTIGWSYALAWNTKVLEERRAAKVPNPKNWKDFWDLDKYPGKRALRDSAQGNIEIALLAKGYSHSEIYDRLYKSQDLSILDEAFDSLNKIKHQIVWWSTGDQLQRELESGRSTLIAAWNGRVWNAKENPILSANKCASCYEISYHDAVIDYDWWIIPKGSTRVKQASTLIKSMYENKTGSLLFAEKTGYGPPIRNWESDIKKSVSLRKYMPTTKENMSKQLKVNPYFWSENHKIISERWDKWKAE